MLVGFEFRNALFEVVDSGIFLIDKFILFDDMSFKVFNPFRKNCIANYIRDIAGGECRR